MVARSSSEEYRRKRRKRLLRALLFGGAAVGIPAAANAIISRRNQRLEAPGWGRTHRYAWRFGEIAFQRLGSGPPLVCLHSFGPGHDAEEWHEDLETAGVDQKNPDFPTTASSISVRSLTSSKTLWPPRPWS